MYSLLTLVAVWMVNFYDGRRSFFKVPERVAGRASYHDPADEPFERNETLFAAPTGWLVMPSDFFRYDGEPAFFFCG